jgi:hypothetical protein
MTIQKTNNESVQGSLPQEAPASSQAGCVRGGGPLLWVSTSPGVSFYSIIFHSLVGPFPRGTLGGHSLSAEGGTQGSVPLTISPSSTQRQEAGPPFPLPTQTPPWRVEVDMKGEAESPPNPGRLSESTQLKPFN